jgi:hypothetical protein
LIIPDYLITSVKDNESVFKNKRLLKHLQKGKKYILSIKNSEAEKWELSRSSANLFFPESKISYRNNEMIVTLIPNNEMFLENIELHRKY